MASITGKPNLFYFTSPRTPIKLIDELRLLTEEFKGERWEKNRDVQKKFAIKLGEAEFFLGKIKPDDYAARDRINRAPKSLGLVDLEPEIKLTDAGDLFVNGQRPHEIFTRQLMKMQLPSPYHKDKNNDFFVKPYLELLRLVYELEGLSKDEIALFIMELIHIDKYEQVKKNILQFRGEKKALDRKKTSYKRLVQKKFKTQIAHIYRTKIESENIQVREMKNKKNDIEKFIKTKKQNHLDYADASIRYLLTTELVSIEPYTYKVKVLKEKKQEVEYLLKETEREPTLFETKNEFKSYLFNSKMPLLYTDDKENLIDEIRLSGEMLDLAFDDLMLETDIEVLKDKRDYIQKTKKERVVNLEVTKLRNYEKYEDIQRIFKEIEKKELVDCPAYLEWNAWRGINMITKKGNVKGNFKIDETGLPIGTAAGKKADIECEFDDYDLLVEVTLSTGAKQYEMEGEPVPRHVGEHKKKSGKDTYCLFIAEKLHPAAIAHFFVLQHVNVSYYGGKTKIIPMSMKDYSTFLEVADDSEQKPDENTLRAFLDYHCENVTNCESEEDWYQRIKESILIWTSMK